MKNPKEELSEYLNILIGRFFYIKNLDNQLKVLKDWESPKRVEAIEVGSHLFGLLSYSFQRTILIELCILLSKREEKSLFDFLLKSEENANAIIPQMDIQLRDNPNISVNQYKPLIQEHKKQLDEKSDIIKRIEARRDKNLAHADATFFNNPNDIYQRYPIDINEIDELMEIISNILKAHHIYLFGVDMDMEFRTSSGTEAILIYIRAYKRIWEDDRLKHINSSIYSQDDYNTTESIYY
ncbi:MAG: hypothetical protein ABR936_09965 [Bacteroidota bacterium]|jgi:hypothetical protein